MTRSVPMTKEHITTRVLVRSILKIEIVTEGGGIYLTAGGQNVQDLKDFYIEGGKSFTIAPANDQYTFTFDNKVMSDCTVEFVLTEVWVGSLSPLIWVLGQAGLLLMVPIGSVIIVYNHYAARAPQIRRARAILILQPTFKQHSVRNAGPNCDWL